MDLFTLHTLDSAPLASTPALEALQKSWNMIPNLHATLAESPVALEAYTAISAIFDKSSLSPAEQQIVYLTASFENHCTYCMAGHCALAKMAKLAQMSDQVINAIRDGGKIEDDRLEALHRFTALVVLKRGFVAQEDVNAFMAAGFTKAQILEVIVGVTVKTLSNYTNHIAETPLDSFMHDCTWTPNSTNPRAA